MWVDKEKTIGATDHGLKVRELTVKFKITPRFTDYCINYSIYQLGTVQVLDK